ncbi:MAG: chitobiase/beta-hexosaminidase C-terminal domain-containing protein [Sinobacteraceae bacterium]|nr:chitobiase/beta-hexosaminidase C-terminal domain-containing protein [Nevskiaceae bacterium]
MTISDATTGSTIYYTTDGSTPSAASSAVYSAPVAVSSTETLKAVAAASGYNNSAVAAATYTITVPTAATPTFSPAAGVYSSAQSVAITDSTPGAVIHYTTNGSSPTSSSPVYSSAINVTSSETLKALAVAPGYNNSAVASALYTINSGSAPLVNYAGGFPSSGGLSLVKASVKSNALVLTDGGHSEARAAWYGTPVNVQSFNTSFTFQLTAGSNTADGFTFTLQNARGGAGAVGALGGALGYAGLAASVAVKFDLYNNAGEGSDSTGFYTNGATPEKPALDMTSSGVKLHSGDVFLVRLTYNGATLHLNITDTRTSASFSASKAINIPAIVGAKSAYVGFTAGTGGLSATQKILTWTYSAP